MKHVEIGADRIARIDKRPFFPIAARHVPTGGGYTTVREAGFNSVRWTPFGMDAFEGIDELPRDFASLYFYAYVYVNGDLSLDTEKRRKALVRLVEAVRERADLLVYEQRNEPAYSPRRHRMPQASPEGMAAGSELIRRLDPHHPIRVGHMTSNLTSTLRKYNPAVDVVGCNPYVVVHPQMRYFVGCRLDNLIVDSPNQTLSAVGDYTSKMMRVADGRAVWMQIQGAANENWFSEAHTPENEGLGMYPHHQLHPSYWEMRFMAYHAVIRGATGLEWMLVRLQVESPQWKEVARVVRELASIENVLAAPTANCELELSYEELGFSDFTGVEYVTKAAPDGPVLIAANTQFDPCQVEFCGLPDGFGEQLEVVGEAREVTVQSERMADRFQPYEVHIYRPVSRR